MDDYWPESIGRSLQEALDSLKEISDDVVRTHDVRLITDILGEVKTIGTAIKMVADEFGVDVDPQTPID